MSRRWNRTTGVLAFAALLFAGAGCGKREITPQDRLRSQAMVKYGIALAEQGKLDSARTVLKKAVDLDSTNVEALYRLGAVYEYSLQPTLAQRTYERALRVDSLDGVVHLNLGQMYGRSGHYDEAIAHFRKAIACDTSHQVQALAYYCIGLADGIQGNSEEAVKAYEQATNIDTSFARAYVGEGQELVRLERYDEAIPVLKRAIAENPSLADAYGHLATSYRMTNRPKEAAAVEALHRRAQAENRNR